MSKIKLKKYIRNAKSAYQKIANFKLSSKLFTNFIYIYWFERYLGLRKQTQLKIDLNIQNLKGSLKKIQRGIIFLNPELTCNF